jgi:hypothetical protein
MKKSISSRANMLVLLFALSSFAFADAADKVSESDAKITELLTAIKNQPSNFDQKKSVQTNKDMVDYMDKACQDPELLSAKLRKASDAGLGIADSPDKKLRVYSWDTYGGGTMHFFHSIAQYEVPGSEQTKVLKLHPDEHPTAEHDDPDAGWYFVSVDPIRTVDGKTVYLVMGDGVFSTIDHGVTVEAYSIEGGKLVKTPFFNTQKSVLDSISCYFHGRDSSGGIELADKKTTLKIPLLTADSVPTGKYLYYKFDGHKFVYKASK